MSDEDTHFDLQKLKGVATTFILQFWELPTDQAGLPLGRYTRRTWNIQGEVVCFWTFEPSDPTSKNIYVVAVSATGEIYHHEKRIKLSAF